MKRNHQVRTCFVIGIILLFIGIWITPAIAQTHEKSSQATTSHWLYVGGSGPGNYTKIQDAIVNASDGDTVFVYNGMYYENITIYRQITVQGENPATTYIDGTEQDNVVYITKNNVCFSGFTVQNSSLFGDAGIIVSADVDAVEITNVHVTDNAIGVLLKSGTGTLLHDTIIYNNTDTGVYVQSKRPEIRNNTITNNRIFGIVLLGENVDYTIIANNVITNHREGIWISDRYPTTHVEITHNMIMNSSTYGLSFGTTNSCIHDNLFYNNTIAVTLSSGQQNNICDNTFENNSRGIWIVGAVKNHIHRNNFLHNQEDAFFTHLIFIPNARNYWYRNYWDTHHSLFPKPIRGQKVIFIPFSLWVNISWIHFDVLPAQHPYTSYCIAL